MKWSRLALSLAMLAAALLLVSGVGTRIGLWTFAVGFQLLRWAAYLGAAATVIALAGALLPRVRATQGMWLIAAVVLGAGVVAVPGYWLQVARSVPPIHDISTDLDDPPAFVAVVPLRADAPNPVAHGGAAVAEAQRSAYPHIQPMVLAASPTEAFTWAIDAVGESGWEMVAQDPASGRIEATATTLWFGFKDDIVVRVSSDAAGSRVDVRSKSRVGRSDAGTNARRIEAYLDRLARIARAAGVARQ